MTDPIEYINGDGDIRYQPKLKSGRSLCLNWFGNRVWVFTTLESQPILYRSKARAIRVANREERRISKSSWERLD